MKRTLAALACLTIGFLLMSGCTAPRRAAREHTVTAENQPLPPFIAAPPEAYAAARPAVAMGWVEPLVPPYFTGPLPLRVKLVHAAGTRYAVGVFAPQAAFVIRNVSDTYAVALRDVGWSYRPGEHDWHRNLYGSSSQDGDNVYYNGMSQQLTMHRFESGLLLPGESLTVTLPVTPQIFGIDDLTVSYLPVGGDDTDWRDEVLIPTGDITGMEQVYGPPTAASIALRGGTGGNGLLRHTMLLEGNTLPVYRAKYPIAFPNVIGSTDGSGRPVIGEDYARTDGIAPYDAGRRAGVDLVRMSYWVFYTPELATWFFVRDDLSAVTLTRTGNVRVSEDGYSNEGWEYNMLGKVAIAAPEYFCRGAGGKTDMILNPQLFGDILTVQVPWTRMYYNPGITPVPKEKLLAVLQKCDELGITLELTAINPNGLGTQYILTAGVKLDAAGRWVSPEVVPLELPLD